MLLVLNVVVVSSIAMELRPGLLSIIVETFATSRSIPRICFIDGEWVHIGVLRGLVPIRESVLFGVRCSGVWLRRFLREVQLAVHVEVVQLGVGHALLSFLGIIGVIIRATLAVGSFFFDDEVLS